MSKIPLLLLILAFLAGLSFFIGLVFLGWQSRNNTPDHLDEQDLSFDPEKPNFVSSLAPDPDEQVAPLSIKGDPEQAWRNAIEAVLSGERTRAAVETEDYFRAESHSKLFGFVDDVELLRKPGESVIHIRSGARVGHSDIGANAARVADIRERFENAQE